jgi:predicted nucleotidyltransferase
MDMPSLPEIAVRRRVRLLLQHGSTVSGQAHPNSDLDIAVLFEDGQESLPAVAAISTDLQGLYPGREIDLAVINHADPLFLEKILERCELLFGSARVLAELRMYAFRRYQDHRRFLALDQSYVRRSLERLAAR